MLKNRTPIRHPHPGRNNQFAYRALIQTPTRPLPPASIVSLDKELAGSKRKLSWALTSDLEQNFVIAGWAVEQHLIYTSSFSFQARTKDAKFNAELEEYFTKRMAKKNIDITARMSLDDMCQTFMASKVWDGDAAMIKTDTGKLQLLESWQIAKHNDAPANVNENGLVLDKHGRAEKYSVVIHDDNGGVQFDQLVDADNIIFDGYFKKANQTRGVSPLMPVLNSARDVMDATAYNLLKSKIGAMFGLVVYRDHGRKGGHDFNYTVPDDEDSGYLKYELRPGLKLELEKDERAEFLESKTPPAEFLNFAVFLLRQILAAIKIPYSMYDSASANFAASKSDLYRYRNSTIPERRQNLAIRDEITEYILQYDIGNGDLVLPPGWTYNDIDWEWIPAVSFVIDRPSEVSSIISMVDRGFTTRANACKELGTGNFFRNAEALGQEERFLREQGVTVTQALPGAPVSNADSGKDDLTSQQDKKGVDNENDRSND